MATTSASPSTHTSLANGNNNGHSDGQQGLCFYVPSPLHPAAYERAAELAVDLIHPSDERSETWWEYSDAIVWRQGSQPWDLSHAHKLKIIVRNGTGYDMVNVQQAKHLGIAVTNLPGFNAEAVAELTYGLAIAVARRVVEFDRRLREGEHVPSAHNMGLSLHRKTVGLVGMGDIAREAALKFHYGSSCKLLIYSPTSPRTRWTSATTVAGEPVIPHERVESLHELLTRSDVVSLHCPEIPETLKMMGSKEFAAMKSSAIFLNLGRGGLVDEDALFHACKTRQIFGAALDVFAIEPVLASTYGNSLFTLPNLIVLPHVAASTIEVTRDSTVTAIETAYAYCNGQGIGTSTLVKELSPGDLSRQPKRHT